MPIKIVDLAAEETPTLDDLLVIRDNATGTTRKITIQTLLTAFKFLYSPTGQMSGFGGTTAPDGWLLCQGQAVDRTTYADLFTVIGTTYGAGNGVDTFNVPDMRGRVLVGKAASGTFQNLNASGGTETETLTISQMPSHAHGVGDPGHAHGVYDPGHYHRMSGSNSDIVTNGRAIEWSDAVDFNAGVTTAVGTGIGIYASGTGISVQNNGGGQAHNNLQPYRVANYIIKT
jgi:microcystin-dependent protein